MEIGLIIRKMYGIHSHLIKFLDSTENNEIGPLIKYIEKYEILKKKEEIISILKMLSSVSGNHHRLPDFVSKLEQIFGYLIQQIRTRVSDFEIYQVFEGNKRALLLLFEGGFIQPDEHILADIMTREDENSFPYRHYLHAGIKAFVGCDELEAIENEIKGAYCEDISEFEAKCREGENDGYICSLIRKDSVVEFISHVNRANIPLSSRIKPSIFETNSFLIRRNTNLAEYAAFFGSIQIIQYLKYNGKVLTDTSWLYAIHSNSAELIHFLEENVELLVITYQAIYEESIKCHHNEIADYIFNNFLSEEQNDNFGPAIVYSSNYRYFPEDIKDVISEQFVNGFRISQLCFSLKEITIPLTVTSIGDYAFSECSSLVKIIIPSSVKSINNYAFSECSSLLKIIIPSSVESILHHAFSKCTSLTQMTIPSSVTSIGNYVFSECSSLAKINILSSANSIGNYSFFKCSSLTQVSISSSVTSIGDYAFSECSSLIKIEIPSSVESICDYAFFKCSSLAHFTIPQSVKLIGECAFAECSSLAQVFIPNSVTSIEESAFSDCSSLVTVTLPSSLASISDSAFRRCSSLAQISFPSSVKSIGNMSFEGCSSLTQIKIPRSVKIVGCCAFKNCSSLAQLSIPPSLKIESNAFIGCDLLSADDKHQQNDKNECEFHFPDGEYELDTQSNGQAANENTCQIY